MVIGLDNIFKENWKHALKIIPEDERSLGKKTPEQLYKDLKTLIMCCLKNNLVYNPYLLVPLKFFLKESYFSLSFNSQFYSLQTFKFTCCQVQMQMFHHYCRLKKKGFYKFKMQLFGCSWELQLYSFGRKHLKNR